MSRIKKCCKKLLTNKLIIILSFVLVILLCLFMKEHNSSHVVDEYNSEDFNIILYYHKINETDINNNIDLKENTFLMIYEIKGQKDVEYEDIDVINSFSSYVFNAVDDDMLNDSLGEDIFNKYSEKMTDRCYRYYFYQVDDNIDVDQFIPRKLNLQYKNSIIETTIDMIVALGENVYVLL